MLNMNVDTLKSLFFNLFLCIYNILMNLTRGYLSMLVHMRADPQIRPCWKYLLFTIYFVVFRIMNY